MTELIDISVPVGADLPIWPGSPGASVRSLSAISEGAEANASELRMDVHTGTHVDAPLHALDDGAPIAALDLGRTVGPALVVDVGPEGAIDGCLLDALPIPPTATRLLLKTSNTARALYAEGFSDDYAALTLEGAEWVAKRGLELIGTDYLSIQRIADSFETHRVLLGADTWILEGLDLSAVAPGEYELICLPLRLGGAEAAPARAILRAL